MSYAAHAASQRLFCSPPSHSSKTPVQGADHGHFAGITPQPRTSWAYITSPTFPDETPVGQWNRPHASRPSMSPGSQSPRTPRTPRQSAPKAPQACWTMDWNEPWLPQPPPPFLPASWGNPLSSPSSSKCPFPCLPSPCKQRPGYSDILGDLAASAQDPNDDRFKREFSDRVQIGKGQFATVFSATNNLDRHAYAVKVQRRSNTGNDKDRLTEVYTLASIASATSSCPNLVRYFSSWMEDGDLHIQTELCSGSLRAQLAERRTASGSSPRFTQDEIAHVIRDVANGLSVLHRLRYAHLDLKPDNVLTQVDATGEICYKLADFGLAAAVP